MSLYNVLNITQLAMESSSSVVDNHRRVIDQQSLDHGGLELNGNLTLVQVLSEVVQEIETQREMSETEYEQFLADVWVGVVLTLMVLSCVCCMCSCLLYHKFQQWKRRVLEQRAAAASREADYRGTGDNESLPSYTLVSGLPSYEEALEQLKQVQALRRGLDHVVIFDCSSGNNNINNNNNNNKLQQQHHHHHHHHQLSSSNNDGNVATLTDNVTTCTTVAISNINNNNNNSNSNNNGSSSSSSNNNNIINNNNSLSHCHNNYVTTQSCSQMSRLSIADLLQIYKIQQQQQQQTQQQQQQQQQTQQQQQIGDCSNLDHSTIVKI